MATKKCKICWLILDDNESDVCSECAELVTMVVNTSYKSLRAMILCKLVDRIGVNEGKTKNDVMREIIEGKRK
jgi:hypothetical protein